MATTIFTVTGLCCPAEEKLIRNKLKSISGIEQLDFNLIIQELKVTHNIADVSAITEAINELGMQTKLKNKSEPTKATATLINNKQWAFIGLGGVLAFCA